MNYCSNCGSGHLKYTVPEGDNRKRYVCPDCQTIHYQNPLLVVGTLATYQKKILLAKRAIEPRLGFWNLPCGFLELNETVEAGALRETEEETGATAKLEYLQTVYNLPHAQQIYLIFKAKITRLNLQETPESLEVKLFHPDEIPWKEIAFSSNTFALEHYISGNQNPPFFGTFLKGKTPQ